MILFFNFLVISFAGSLLSSVKIFTEGKKLLLSADRFSSCENVVSRPRPRVSPPPPEWKDHLFNCPQAIENYILCLLVRTDILQNQSLCEI